MKSNKNTKSAWTIWSRVRLAFDRYFYKNDFILYSTHRFIPFPKFNETESKKKKQIKNNNKIILEKFDQRS